MDPTGGHAPPRVVLYSAPGCHLCHEARLMLDLALATRRRRGLATPVVEEIDIHSDDTLERRYLELIPVIELNGHRLELATSAVRIGALLATALDGATPDA